AAFTFTARDTARERDAGDGYIEASNSGSAAVSTGFHTGVLTGGAWCLSVRYQDPAAPSLLALVVLSDGSRAARAFTSQATGSRTWGRGSVTIASDKEFRVSLHVAIAPKSSVALDDFALRRGKCTDTTDVVYLDLLHGQRVHACSFDEPVGTCGWHGESGSASVRWVVKTHNPFFGPQFDHTLGRRSGRHGSFLLRDNWRKPRGSKARITSPTVTLRVVPGCLHFWLYAHGASPGDVSVYLRPEGGSERQVWHANLRGLVGMSWTEVRVRVETLLPFKIVLQSTVYHWFNGVAVDDIHVENTPCA
ncbi:hypothetical protein BaRGS_00010350, partial [Batillaria attramentaria]